MRDHTVAVDTSLTPSEIEFSPVYNAAVTFIDRHLEEGRGGKNAILGDGGSVTYAELAANVNRCGNVLANLGLARGERVVMVVKDCAEFFYLFWGAIKAGFVPVPINTMLRAQDLQYFIKNSQCAAVIYSPEFAGEVDAALKESDPGPAHPIPVDGEGTTIVSLMAGASPDLSPVAAGPDDDCFWLYSSGSTGAPKGVVHAHAAFAATCQYYAVETLGMGEDDVCFSAAKLFFAYGLGNAMTFPLWLGATAVLFAGRPDPGSMFKNIEAYKPTIFFGVPTLYAALLRAMETETPDLSSVRVYVSAGEALPPNILERWRAKTGHDVYDSIGTTEILHIFLCNTAEHLRPGSSGRPVTGYEAKIVDDAGKYVAQGETGRLMIRGDSLFKHYWRNPKKTAQSLLGGWLATGDTYYEDEDGYFVCCGRSDDMLKVGGIWCSPVEIEAKLVEHPKVLEAAIVGRADGDKLIKPEAHVVLNDPADASPELAKELLQHCKSGLAPYKYPRWFNFIDDLPKTATGKIQRFKLRENA